MHSGESEGELSESPRSGSEAEEALLLRAGGFTILVLVISLGLWSPPAA